MFVIPILEKLSDMIIADINAILVSEASLQTKLVIFCIILFIFYGFYLIIVPLKRIEDEIKTTNAMIALMPPDPQQQPNKTANK